MNSDSQQLPQVWLPLASAASWTYLLPPDKSVLRDPGSASGEEVVHLCWNTGDLLKDWVLEILFHALKLKARNLQRCLNW